MVMLMINDNTNRRRRGSGGRGCFPPQNYCRRPKQRGPTGAPIADIHLGQIWHETRFTLFATGKSAVPVHLQPTLSRQPRSSVGGGWGQGRAASVRLAGPHAQAARRQQELKQRAGEVSLRRGGEDADTARHI